MLSSGRVTWLRDFIRPRRHLIKRIYLTARRTYVSMVLLSKPLLSFQPRQHVSGAVRKPYRRQLDSRYFNVEYESWKTSETFPGVIQLGSEATPNLCFSNVLRLLWYLVSRRDFICLERLGLIDKSASRDKANWFEFVLFGGAMGALLLRRGLNTYRYACRNHISVRPKYLMKGRTVVPRAS